MSEAPRRLTWLDRRMAALRKEGRSDVEIQQIVAAEQEERKRRVGGRMDAAEVSEPLRPAEAGGPEGAAPPEAPKPEAPEPEEEKKAAKGKKAKKEPPPPPPVPEWQLDGSVLPDDCPVIPLGMTEDSDFVFLTARRHLSIVEARQFTKTVLPKLFTPREDFMQDTWPQYSKPDENMRFTVTGWNANDCAKSLRTACGRIGAVWNADDRLRGRGAHRDPEGNLILHSGRVLTVGGRPASPGVIGRLVLPAAADWMQPGDAAEAPERFAALLDLLGSWSWKRGRPDALFLGGFNAAAMVGGALRVRPVCWITGEYGTGKSTVTERDGVIHRLFDGHLIISSNTTAAGIYRHVKHDTVPVIVDEGEASKDNRRIKGVVELAREAYSGGQVLRGSENGESFTVRSSIAFSSILIPPLKPQDLSRMAILSLEKLREGQEAPDLAAADLPRTGRAMLARWVERWHLWEGRYATWRAFLMSKGFDQRGAAQYGTLLAAADFMLHDEAPDSDSLEEIAGWMTPASVAETTTRSSDAENCANYMMSRVSPYIRSGRQQTLGELLRLALGFVDHTDADHDEGGAGSPAGGGGADLRARRTAQQELERCGLKPVMIVGDKLLQYAKVAPRDADPAKALVAIATQGEGILKIFDGSDWQGEAGSYNPYTQALLRLPGATMSASSGAPLRFAAVLSRAVLVPAARLVGLDDADEADAFG